jgi:hypothetical protein
MARSAKPWFCAQTGWWTVWQNGKRVRLVEGKANRKAAHDALQDRLYTARHNPTPETPAQTVVSVIERYLEVAVPALAPQTQQFRTMYLQSFCELHGWRLVTGARPESFAGMAQQEPAVGQRLDQAGRRGGGADRLQLGQTQTDSRKPVRRISSSRRTPPAGTLRRRSSGPFSARRPVAIAANQLPALGSGKFWCFSGGRGLGLRKRPNCGGRTSTSTDA